MEQSGVKGRERINDVIVILAAFPIPFRPSSLSEGMSGGNRVLHVSFSFSPFFFFQRGRSWESMHHQPESIELGIQGLYSGSVFSFLFIFFEKQAETLQGGYNIHDIT